MPESILVVEDEPALLDTLAYNLKAAGYSVQTAADGRTAIQMALTIRPDLIVLDVMLPEKDGFEVARTVRRELNAAIIMLTARSDEIDRVVGLEVGADDYLTKPFSMRELLARVKAMLRRTQLLRDESSHTAESAHRRLEFGDLVIDATRREVTRASIPLALKAQGIRVAALPRRAQGPHALPPVHPGACLGLGFRGGQSHGGRAHSLVAAKDRS